MIRKMFVLLSLASVLAFAAEDPVNAVKKKDAELQTLLKKSSRNAKETERVKSLLNDSFDFALLAKKSLSKGDWEKQDAASQEKFVAEFQRMVRNSSAKRLELYRADSTVYEPAKMKGTDEARVVAHLWNKGKESVLEYKMSLVKWFFGCMLAMIWSSIACAKFINPLLSGQVYNAGGGLYDYVPELTCGAYYETKRLANKVLNDNDNGITTGSGLYMKVNGKIITNDAELNMVNSENYEYIFRGDIVNNYVKIDNDVWRIVSIDNDNNLLLIYNDESFLLQNHKYNDQISNKKI